MQVTYNILTRIGQLNGTQYDSLSRSQLAHVQLVREMVHGLNKTIR